MEDEDVVLGVLGLPAPGEGAADPLAVLDGPELALPVDPVQVRFHAGVGFGALLAHAEVEALRHAVEDRAEPTRVGFEGHAGTPSVQGPWRFLMR